MSEPREFLTCLLPELKNAETSEGCSSVLPAWINSYESLYKYSIENTEEFWSLIAKRRLQWFKEFDSVTNTTEFNGDSEFRLEWFGNGKLNVAVNCVDRHYLVNPSKIALIWDKDEPNMQEYVTYSQLYKMMNQIANMFRSYGIKKGDRVALYCPCCPMAVACMLACARIGAIHSVVFAGFSAEALASRINDSKCCAVVTANQSVRAGKVIELKKTVEAALVNCKTVKHMFVMKRTDAEFTLNQGEIPMDEEMLKHETECEPEQMDSEDPLFMLYTSGSTGKPKGVIHSQAGYLLYASFTFQTVFNYQEGDIFGCLADIGWITGHSYVVYGPLSVGGTTVLFESSPIYPDAGRYWQTVERLKISQLYVAPTALRLLIKYGNEWVKKYDRSSLKCLGSVGEPLNTEAWSWYHDIVGEGKCRIADTWWQTETGGHCITPLPCAKDAHKFKPGKAMRPFFGIQPVLVDENGNELDSKSSEGILCIKKPWPGMARTIYDDHDRFLETYLKPFPGYYFTGDGASVDEDGHYQITGRIDDVLNVSGHRVGTAEIESYLTENKAVAEAAVVAYPHELYGDGIYAYICLKQDVSVDEKTLINELKSLIKSKIAAHAVPHKFLITPHLPKTRSGKIMRRILRKIASNLPEELGDISTLAEPHVVDEIIELHKSKNA